MYPISIISPNRFYLNQWENGKCSSFKQTNKQNMPTFREMNIKVVFFNLFHARDPDPLNLKCTGSRKPHNLTTVSIGVKEIVAKSETQATFRELIYTARILSGPQAKEIGIIKPQYVVYFLFISV
jgi:hypothetical protein